MEFHKEIEDQRESTPGSFIKASKYTNLSFTYTDVIKISWI